MLSMHSKYNNIHKNEMFNALICINNHVIMSINCMLSLTPFKIFEVNWLILMSSMSFMGVRTYTQKFESKNTNGEGSEEEATLHQIFPL